VFLSISLVCSAVREVIETFSKMRAMDLERGLRELLDDKDGGGFTTKLFDHPMIFGHRLAWGGDWTHPDTPHFQWGACKPSPSDRARQLLDAGGVRAVWAEVGAV
jgi:hypothetical protein